MTLPRTERPRARTSLVWRLTHPQTTVRWRLTLLYGGMFLACGAALLAVTYTLVSHSITGGWGISLPSSGQASRAPAGTPVSARPPPQGRVPNQQPSPGSPTQPPTSGAARVSGSGAIPLPPPTLTVPQNLPRAVLRVFNSPAGHEFARLVETQQQVTELNQLELESAIALGIMTIVSGLLGWLVAGRVLRPLRAITTATQQISETNLHRRLDMPGPRDELRTLADTIDGLLARLEAAFESQRQFVANASHELRTPLATMRAALDVAIAKPHLSPQVRVLDASLREDLDQADGLLESFLVLARAQRAALGEETRVSLPQVIEAALARRHGAIAAKEIEVHSTLAPTYVDGSKTLLARMVDNLIDNAVRHNLPRGLINVACDADRQTARLVVESGGPVLDRQAVDQLAKPFRRLGVERTGSQNGHGLGLSIVAAVAAAHGGELRLYPREQGGLGAEIALALAPDAQAAAAAT